MVLIFTLFTLSLPQEVLSQTDHYRLNTSSSLAAAVADLLVVAGVAQVVTVRLLLGSLRAVADLPNLHYL
jgi:hypothetical protein